MCACGEGVGSRVKVREWVVVRSKDDGRDMLGGGGTTTGVALSRSSALFCLLALATASSAIWRAYQNIA